tara:strand:+ start:77 stop:226 length:150 start_codon:yes stop_codon:yes gene_type:complete
MQLVKQHNPKIATIKLIPRINVLTSEEGREIGISKNKVGMGPNPKIFLR